MFFFFNDTATTEIYTLSLHDALPISIPVASISESAGHRAPIPPRRACCVRSTPRIFPSSSRNCWPCRGGSRSEEHTSELQSQSNLVCRLLLEKKNKKYKLEQSDTLNH